MLPRNAKRTGPPSVRRQIERRGQIGNDGPYAQPGHLALQRGARLVEERLTDVDRDVHDVRHASSHRVEQDARLGGASRPQLDQRSVPRCHDLVGPRRENLSLGAREVVLRERVISSNRRDPRSS